MSVISPPNKALSSTYLSGPYSAIYAFLRYLSLYATFSRIFKSSLPNASNFFGYISFIGNSIYNSISCFAGRGLSTYYNGPLGYYAARFNFVGFFGFYACGAFISPGEMRGEYKSNLNPSNISPASYT